MPILPHFSDQHPGAAAMFFNKGINIHRNPPPFGIIRVRCTIDAGHGLCIGHEATVHLLQRVGDLPHRCSGARRLNGEGE